MGSVEPVGGGWGAALVVLSTNKLIRMCQRMGSHFHDWVDYHRFSFSIELLEWGWTLLDILGDKKIPVSRN